MKILILGFAKIKYMPYLDFYLKNIDCDKHNVSVVYWNRDLKEENVPFENVHFYEFRAKQEDDGPKFYKIWNFLKYRRFAQKLLKQDFDRVIVLHSLPGVLNWKTLTKKYRNRFVFDFRDVTYERFSPYRRIIDALVKNSFFTSISSDGFRRFLPQDSESKIITNHNILADSLLYRDCGLEKVPSERIRIAFWGYIREENLNRRIIQCVARDLRFELHYYGREQQIALNLKKYAQEICASNVYFHGEYVPEDRYDFVKRTDIIHNVYCESQNMMNAVGNKFYDGLIFYLPQICMTGSYMGNLVAKNGLGLSVNPFGDEFLNLLHDWFSRVDKSLFMKNCEIVLDHCLADMKIIDEMMINVVK